MESFKDYWGSLSPDNRRFVMERVGISQPYISLMVNAKAVPSKPIRDMLEVVTGRKFLWVKGSDK